MIKKIIQKFHYKFKYFYIKKSRYNGSYLNILDEYQLDENLEKHMFRVSKYSELLADLMCLDSKKIEYIKQGALLHDIGKKLIDEKILNKPDKLTSDEFEIMKTHSKLGLKILNKKYRNKNIENIILFHHEKWNGKGYPFGLESKTIPIEARIVSIADCYDALTSNRVYKVKISHEKALDILKSESGKSFDPDMIAIFEIFENKFKKIMEKNHEDKR